MFYSIQKKKHVSWRQDFFFKRRHVLKKVLAKNILMICNPWQMFDLSQEKRSKFLGNGLKTFKQSRPNFFRLMLKYFILCSTVQLFRASSQYLWQVFFFSKFLSSFSIIVFTNGNKDFWCAKHEKNTFFSIKLNELIFFVKI